MRRSSPIGWRRLLLVFPLLFLLACDSGSDLEALDGGAFVEWETAAPSSQNLNAQTLGNLTQALARGDYGSVHSLLIARNSVPVYEEYFRGATPERMVYALQQRKQPDDPSSPQ